MPADRTIEFQGRLHDLECCTSFRGFRCGYVRLPEGCRMDREIEAGSYPEFDVHGGVTWCERRLPWDPDDATGPLWIGFDCAHAGDQAHGLQGVLRSLDYVLAECEKLAGQIRERVGVEG